ncbi:hypothetical protein D3C86_1799700 [compost metagenome]
MADDVQEAGPQLIEPPQVLNGRLHFLVGQEQLVALGLELLDGAGDRLNITF